MRLIPVLDIKGGFMVHAVGGQRGKYKPVESKLFPGSNPLAAVSALHDLAFNCFYIADLDAITRSGDNFDLIKGLLFNKEITLWLDAGISSGDDLKNLPFGHQVSLIIGSETLKAFDSLKEIADVVGHDRIIFSLDIIGERVLSPNPNIAAKEAVEVADTVRELGVSNIIIIDLVNVGKKSGPNIALISRLVRELPAVNFYPGGGVRNDKDLTRLKGLDVAGTLVATSLYSGVIDHKKWVSS